MVNQPKACVAIIVMSLSNIGMAIGESGPSPARPIPHVRGNIFSGFSQSVKIDNLALKAGADPMLITVLRNNSSASVAIRLSGSPVLDIGVTVIDEHGHNCKAVPLIPSSWAVRSRIMNPGDQVTEAALLSTWGYHLSPGACTIFANRNPFSRQAVPSNASQMKFIVTR